MIWWLVQYYLINYSNCIYVFALDLIVIFYGHLLRLCYIYFGQNDLLIIS